MDLRIADTFAKNLAGSLRHSGASDEAEAVSARAQWLRRHLLSLQLATPVWQGFLLPADSNVRNLHGIGGLHRHAHSLAVKASGLVQSSDRIRALMDVPARQRMDTELAALCLLRVCYGTLHGDASVTAVVPHERWIELADHFGMWRLRYFLEDARFFVDDPFQYDTIRQLLAKQERKNKRLLTDISTILRHAFTAAGLKKVDIQFRKKNIAGIAEKMRRKKQSVNRITDVFGFRLITERVPECYAVREVLHRLWRPYPDNIDDFIVHPKPNGYQSLHSIVVCLRGLPVEFQIRTRAMDWIAKYGPAAHASYKRAVRSSGAPSASLPLAPPAVMPSATIPQTSHASPRR